jgi:hypothetical protein
MLDDAVELIPYFTEASYGQLMVSAARRVEKARGLWTGSIMILLGRMISAYLFADSGPAALDVCSQ